MKALTACLLALTCALAHAREPAGILTIVDGQAVLVRGASRFHAAEGVAVEPEDLVDTGSASGLVRIEWADGTVLDLGPGTRAMLDPAGPALAGAHAYVLAGWAKLGSTAGTPMPGRAGAPMLATPWLDVHAMERDVVLRTQGAEAGLFAESGSVQVRIAAKGTPAGKAPFQKVDRGTFLGRAADGTVAKTARPPAAFLQAVPRAFMDTLPSRAALFKGKEVRLAPAGRLAYADAQDWLNAEPRLRTRFLARCKPLLQDEAFRRPLIEQMAQHPEWRPIVFPPQAASRPGVGHPASSTLSPHPVAKP